MFHMKGCAVLVFELGLPILGLQKISEYLHFQNKASLKGAILFGFQG